MKYLWLFGQVFQQAITVNWILKKATVGRCGWMGMADESCGYPREW